MHEALVIQRPAAQLSQVMLLFHGVASNAEHLQPLGEALAREFPQAAIISVRAPDPSGNGRQWFSVQDITDANRPARVFETIPRFVQSVRYWQGETGMDAAATTIIGFSQGAIMALESTQLQQPLACRVVAISGRYAQVPRRAPPSTRVYLVHGDADRVIPVRMAVEAQDQLRSLGTPVTLDQAPELGHRIDGWVIERVVEHMRS